MKTVLISLIVTGVLCAGIFFGRFWAHMEYQRTELEKDATGKYHNACKSRIVGKLNGKPCTLCSKKWALDHPEKMSEEEKIVKYCEKINGKVITQFTEQELTECVLMFLE